MNILFVVPYVPNLIRVRPYNLIKHLGVRRHKVSVLTLWTEEWERQDIEKLEQVCHRVYAAHLPKMRSLRNSLAALPTKLPLQANYCWQPSLRKQLRELAQSSGGKPGFDVVHVEHLRGVRYGLELKTSENSVRQIPVVWDSVDSISMLFRQAAMSSKSRFSRWLARFELGRTERYESWLVSQFDKILVTSQADKNAFLSLRPVIDAESRITVLPNGVDLDYFSPDDGVDREPATMVISGKMSYHANIAMVFHFVENILPKIWVNRPDAKLYVVGKDPPREIAAVAEDPRITVTGTVDDIRPYLRKATVSVTPIMYGAGIQNKVLEAMACAIPVVSSPQAFSALSLTPGKDLLSAQSPDDFATAVLCLLDNPKLQREVGEAGRYYVERNHRWDTIIQKLEYVYQETIDSRNL